MTLPERDGKINSPSMLRRGLAKTLTEAKADQLYSQRTNRIRTNNPLGNLANKDKSNTTSENGGSGIAQSILEQAAYDKKKKEWGAYFEAEFQKCKNARSSFERQWYLNLAFSNGRQYVAPITVANEGFRLTTPKSPPWRVKMVINKTRTAVITKCAKLNVSRPMPVVIPATGEEQDYHAARIAEQILKAQFSTAAFNETYRSWLWWGVVCGVSYLKSYYDPNTPDDDLMEPSVDGQPQQPVMGKICIERITPFHLYVPDLLAESLEDQPYIIHAMTRSKEQVKKDFEIDVTPDTRASSTIMESAFIVAKSSESHLDAVLVKEVWIKPGAHKDFPEGGMLTIIQGQVVQCKETWPWPFKQYPFYKYDGLYTGGFYSDSFVVDLIPVQKEYNRTKSQIIEIKNTMGKPKYIAQQGSINPRMISSEPGQTILYKMGFNEPKQIPAAEIPQTMAVELDRLTADFDDISGQHEITRGNTPSQVTSGTAISFLQEQDDTKLNYEVASIETAIEKLGKHYLKYVSTYWTESRLIKVTGKDDTFEALQWKGSDLQGNTDVRVQTGSGLPFSKAARQAFVKELMDAGYLDPVLGMEMLSLGGLDRALDELLIDKRQAQRENLKMANLDPEMIEQEVANQETLNQAMEIQTGVKEELKPFIPVNSWDNHEMHIMFHNNFRKTQDFELLADPVKQQFELHVQMHQMAMVSEQVGQLGSVANDPEAPITDEAGNLVPNPLSQGEEVPPVGSEEAPPNPDELAMLAQMQKMEQDKESHELKLEAQAVDIKNKKETGGKGSAPRGG